MGKHISRSIAAMVIVATAGLGAHAALGSSKVDTKTFKLFPNTAFVTCLEKSAGVTPTASATVTRGNLNDTLTLKLHGFKPGLGFDLFTVQNSNQQSDGSPVPGFTSFGMAWYQSDVEVNANGNASVTIQTILLDQIFGFDPAVGLTPVNTFHVGFWFDNPNTPVPCGYSGTPTPFNGEHNAGPVAFITRPNGRTGLGPLCTDPFKSGGTFSCHP